MQMADSTDDYESELAKAQLEKITLENERLRLELSNLKRGHKLVLLPYLPLITVLITMAGFGFGIYQYRAQQKANREAQADQSKRDFEAREAQSKRNMEEAQRDFMKPLLQNQLTLYLQASSAAATISHSTDPDERKKAVNEFWRLYDGPLIAVESKEVSGAMARFGSCLTGENCDSDELSQRSRALGSRIQESLLKSWNTNPENFATDKFHYR